MCIKVSILVPFYKVEKYVGRCVESLFAQTYQNIEYVFVNDCTKDRSVEILQQTIDRFPERKSQVILIQHEHNKGLGGARHTAFAASRGRYIMHVDGDDLLPLDAVEKLVKAAEKSGADIVDGGFADWENGQATLFHPAAHDSHRTYQRKLLCQNITSNRRGGTSHVLCQALFHRRCGVLLSQRQHHLLHPRHLGEKPHLALHGLPACGIVHRAA